MEVWYQALGYAVLKSETYGNQGTNHPPVKLTWSHIWRKGQSINTDSEIPKLVSWNEVFCKRWIWLMKIHKDGIFIRIFGEGFNDIYQLDDRIDKDWAIEMGRELPSTFHLHKIKSVRHKVGVIVVKNQCLTSSNKSHEKLIIVEPSSWRLNNISFTMLLGRPCVMWHKFDTAVSYSSPKTGIAKSGLASENLSLAFRKDSGVLESSKSPWGSRKACNGVTCPTTMHEQSSYVRVRCSKSLPKGLRFFQLIPER